MSGRAGRLGILALLNLSQGLGPGLTAFALPLILRAHGMTLAQAGFATLLIWPTVLKFAVGPWIDRVQADAARRRWLLAPLQLAFAACFIALAFASPADELWAMLGLIGALNVLAAALDVAIGGFARRILRADERALGQAVQLVAYYAGAAAASGGLLTLVEFAGWSAAVLGLAGLATVATLAGFAARRFIGDSAPVPEWRTFRPDVAFAITALVALLLDLPQNVGIALLGPFLHDAGLSLAEAGRITGGIGLAAAAAGALAGGAIALRPENRTRRLAVLAVAQCLALLPLAALGNAADGVLVAAVCLATASAAAFNAALGAWFMDRVRSATAATEFALLGSLHAVGWVIAGPLAGLGAEAFGAPALLTLAALVGLAVTPLLALARLRAASSA